MAGLTSFERDLVFSSLVGQDDRHCLPYDAATLRSEIFPTRPFVALREITNARDKLVALGVFLRKASPKKEWLEIAPEYRHTEGQNATSFGDESPPSEQGHLSLGPMLLENAWDAPRMPRAKKNNPLRAEMEQKQSRYPDSSASAPNSRTREHSLGDDSGRFARDDSYVRDDPLWGSLCRVVGLSEMTRNGALWLKRYRLCRDALAIAVRDFLSMTEENRRKCNAAAYITTAFENEKLRVKGISKRA